MLEFAQSFYEKLFRNLENNAVLDRVEPDGTYYPVWCSDEFLEMVEGTEEEYIRTEGGGAMQSVHPDDREEIAFLFKNHHTRSGESTITIRKRTLKGRWIWVCIHYSFVKENGVQYAYCDYFDVTDIKNNELRLRAMYDNMNRQLTALSDDALTVMRANATAGVVEEVHGRDLYSTDWAGISIQEFARSRIESMPIEEDRQRYRDTFRVDSLLERFYNGEEAASVVIFTRRLSGRQCFVRYTASARIDPVTGDVITYGIETEYNSEKVDEVMNEKVLAQQYDMIAYLVDGQYGVVIGDERRITRGSIFPHRRYGSYEEYIREQVLPVAVHTDRTILAEVLSLPRVERELETQEPYSVDVACEIGGEVFYKRFSYYVVDRAARFYMVLKTDFTEFQRAQTQRNEQLRSALESAKEGSRAKTAFLSRMSHEIRTPMNAIIGLDAIALREPDLSPRTREHLEKIDSSAKYLLSLINDILDMSRIESGKMVLKNEEFDLREFLSQINALISGQCQAKGLTYECVTDPQAGERYIGDSVKLKQVLINILGNAVKFTPAPGKVTFTVERAAAGRDQDTLRFLVADTGVGMDQAFLARIFEPFSQEDEQNTSAYGGSGLGLAISKSIVTMMNGDISVESRKGTGSTFIVDVTLRTCEREEAELPAELPAELRVLVVDDQEVDRHHAEIVLEEAGVSCVCCRNREEAVKLVRLHDARREDFNLVLVDLRMPLDNGIEVTRAIRAAAGEECAIILLTAYSWMDVEQEAEKAGVDGFMRKPLDPATMMEQFRAALRRRARKRDGEPLDLSGRRILLAEDMLINAEIMKELLSMRGMEVDHAENGEFAVMRFVESPANHYDAVLMDVRMPEMDGLTATQTIRALPRPDAAAVPIIAMTANAFDEDVQRSLQAGMDAHLSKPVEPDKLYETLEHFIKKGRKS